METFAERVAVITGAGSGIGRALCLAAAARGMRVVAADVEEPSLAETVALVHDAGGVAIGVPTDVSSADSVEALATRSFEEFGGVHLLCNNAGVFSGGFVWERTVADFEWTMAVNVYGIVHAIRSFVPRMLAAGEEGHVVNTSSMGGLVTNAYSGPYFTSKFAAVGLTECLAHDLAAVGAPIGVSLWCPAWWPRTSARRSGTAASASSTGGRRPGGGRPVRLADDPGVHRCGMAPADVADLVFDAVSAGRFLRAHQAELPRADRRAVRRDGRPAAASQSRARLRAPRRQTSA